MVLVLCKTVSGGGVANIPSGCGCILFWLASEKFKSPAAAHVLRDSAGTGEMKECVMALQLSDSQRHCIIEPAGREPHREGVGEMWSPSAPLTDPKSFAGVESSDNRSLLGMRGGVRQVLQEGVEGVDEVDIEDGEDGEGGWESL